MALTTFFSRAFLIRNSGYLDPRTGKQYKTRARLSSNGKHLTLYNVDLATNASRKMTWVKY